MQIDETVHGCPVGRRCGSPDRQVGDPGSPSQIRTTSGQPPLVAARRPRYVMLTNNGSRKPENVNTSNPRPNNAFGHIIEMTPAGGDHASTTFAWDILVK